MNTILRKVTLVAFLSTIFGCVNSTQKSTYNEALSQNMDRPNILFVFADDQSWLHTSAFGDKVVKTPAFDRVAEEGVLFTHSFTASPSCTPSRSAVISGQDIWRIGQAGVLFGSIPANLKIYPHMLEESGYHVGYTGKGWLPGDFGALGLKKDPIGTPYNSKLEGHLASGVDKRDYTENFKDFLTDRKDGQPFCFWFGSTEPHRVYEEGVGKMSGKKVEDVEVPPFWPNDDVVKSDMLDYYYEIEWYDSHLASMLKILEEQGELDNTLIVVTSDNGMPFPRAKTTLYDWGTRMPLAIRWGNKIKGGRVVDDLVSHTDFAPTFLEAAGLDIPTEMTGKSLLSILMSEKEGEVEKERDHIFTATERHTWCRPEGATYPARAIRSKEYLYIRNFESERWPTGGPDFVSSNRTYHGDVDASPTKTFILEHAAQYPEEYEWNFGKRPMEELYKIADDPGQTKNLAYDPEYQSSKNAMWDQLKTHLEETGDPRILGLDPWQGYIYHQIDGFGASYNLSLPEDVRNRHNLRPGN